MAISLLNLPQFRKQGLNGEPGDVKQAGVLGTPSVALGQAGTDADPFGALTASTVGTTRQVGPITTPDVKQYAFNPKYAAADQALLRRIANAGAQRTGAISQAETDYGYATDDASRQRDKAQTTLSNRLAAQGILHSSIRADKQGDLTEDFTRYMDALSRKLAGAKQGAEFDYASVLGDIGAQREGLYMQQTSEEEAARLAEAQRAAEAQAKQYQADQQAALMRALIEQEQNRQSSYQGVSYGAPGGYGIGVPSSAQPAYQQPAAAPDAVVLPAFNNGVTRQGVESWIHNNVDPYVSGTAMDKVIEVLSKAGPTGVSRNDLAWLITQYPNVATSGGDKVYGGRFR